MAEFNLSIGRAPERRQLTGVIGGDWGEFVEPLTKLLPGDVVVQAAFTAKADRNAPDADASTVQAIITPDGAASGVITPDDAHAAASLRFVFTPAQTQKMLSAPHADVQAWVQRGGQTLFRTVLEIDVSGEQGVTTLDTLLHELATLAFDNAPAIALVEGGSVIQPLTARDAGAASITVPPLVYDSSDPDVATVDADGTIHMLVPAGAALIRARVAADLTKEAVLTVNATPNNVAATVVVTPNPAPVLGVGATQQFVRTVRNAQGRDITGAVAAGAWAVVGNPVGGGNITGAGLLTLTTEGDYIVSHTVAGITGTANGHVASADDAFVAAFNAAAPSAFEPAQHSNARRFRTGQAARVTTYQTARVFPGPDTRMSEWRSIDGTSVAQFAVALYMDGNVTRDGGLIVFGFVGKPGAVAVGNRVITALLEDPADGSGRVHWSDNQGNDWGTTNNGAAPAAAPFIAFTANFGGGAGYVAGVRHSFNAPADRSCSCDPVTLHPTELDRLQGPVGMGAIPAGGRSCYVLAAPIATQYTSFGTRGPAPVTPPMGGVAGAPPNTAIFAANSSTRNGSSADANGCELSVTGGSSRTPPIGGPSAGKVALFLGHFSGNLEWVSSHYDRVGQDASRHDPISAPVPPAVRLPGLSAAETPWWIHTSGWATPTPGPDRDAGYFIFEWGYLDGEPSASQYDVWNNWMRAHNADLFNGRVVPEYTADVVMDFSHSVDESMNNNRMQTKLGAPAWFNFSKNGAMTREIPTYYLRDIYSHMNLSKIGKHLCLVKEGVNDSPTTASGTVAGQAAFYAQLSEAAVSYRDPNAVAAKCRAVLVGILHADIGEADASPAGSEWARVLNNAMDAGGAEDVVATGRAEAFINSNNDRPLTMADHNTSEFWQDPHLTDEGEDLNESFVAARCTAILATI